MSARAHRMVSHALNNTCQLQRSDLPEVRGTQAAPPLFACEPPVPLRRSVCAPGCSLRATFTAPQAHIAVGACAHRLEAVA
jgi:hypothetical protein